MMFELMQSLDNILFLPFTCLMLSGCIFLIVNHGRLAGSRKISIFFLSAIVLMIGWRCCVELGSGRYFSALIVPAICLSGYALLLFSSQAIRRGILRCLVLIIVILCIGKALNPPYYKEYLLEIGEVIRQDVKNEKFFVPRIYINFPEAERVGYYSGLKIYNFQDQISAPIEFTRRFEKLMENYPFYDAYYFVLREKKIDPLMADIEKYCTDRELKISEIYTEKSEKYTVKIIRISHAEEFYGEAISNAAAMELAEVSCQKLTNGNFRRWQPVAWNNWPWNKLAEKFETLQFHQQDVLFFPMGWQPNPAHVPIPPRVGFQFREVQEEGPHTALSIDAEGGIVINCIHSVPVQNYQGILIAKGNEGSVCKLYAYCAENSKFLQTIQVATCIFQDTGIRFFSFQIDPAALPEETTKFRLAIGIENGDIDIYKIDLF